MNKKPIIVGLVIAALVLLGAVFLVSKKSEAPAYPPLTGGNNQPAKGDAANLAPDSSVVINNEVQNLSVDSVNLNDIDKDLNSL